MSWLSNLFRSNCLPRERLFDLVVATCPVSYWISFDGDVEALKQRLSR